MLVLHDNDGLEPDLKDELEQGFLSSQFGKPLLLKTSQELRMLSSVRKQRLSSIQVLNCQNSNQCLNCQKSMVGRYVSRYVGISK